MSKPTRLPRWATDVSAVIEPSEAKKNTGYLTAEMPAPKVLNWLLYMIYGWCSYLNGLHMEPDFLGQTYTWTAQHVFNVRVLVGGLRSSGHVQLVGSDIHYTDGAGAAALRTRYKHIPFTFAHGGTLPSGQWEVGFDGAAQANGGATDGFLYIDLPSGCVLSSIAVGVLDGVGQSLTTRLERDTVSLLDGLTTVTTLGPERVSAGTNAYQLLIIGPLSETIDTTGARYRLVLQTPVAGIRILAIYATYQDPGFLGNT